MTSSPVLPDGYRPDGKWGAATAALINGQMILVKGESIIRVAGGLKRGWLTKQGYHIKTKTTPEGVLAWMEKR